ncbi:MAG: PAS domain S-box protein [Myxococcales bacterium]
MVDEVRDSFWNQRRRSELEAREAAYREQLRRQHDLSQRLRACSDTLQRVLRNRPPNDTNLLETMHAIAVLTAQAVQVRRVSVWLTDRHGNLGCRVLLVDGVQVSADGLLLRPADAPSYFSALRAEEPLAVTDTRKDARLRELRAYLEEHNVGALLDIAVLAQGEPIGVVCLEHLGGTRTWWPAELAFASQLGSLVALGVEAERRVRAEYAAQEAQARYRNLVESLPVTVYSMDAGCKRLRYLSPKVNEFGGFSVGDWLRMGPRAWLNRIVKEDRPRVLERYRKDLSRGFADELVYRVHLEGRGVCWIRDSSTLIRDAQGNPMAFQGVLADITAQREAELAREESERRARTLLHNIAMIAVHIDTEGRIQDVNPYFSLVLGYERDEVLGTSWYDYLDSREEAVRLHASYDAALRVGAIAPRVEYAIRTKAGDVRRLLWTRTVLKDTSGRSRGVITLGMDLTDRLRLEAELTQQAKLESLGHLASAVAHDFNNLLTVIMNQTAFLACSAHGERAERSKASLEAALTQAKELTQSLLVYARKTPEHKQVTDVDELLQQLQPLVQAMAGRSLRITEHLHAEGGSVLIDRSRLRQLILNLVTNAAQATDGHGHDILLTSHVEFVDAERAGQERLDCQGEFVVVGVEDDGRGMDELTLSKVFEPFFTTKAEGEGTGLGLAICQSIVREAGGFLEVDSELNKGTRMRIFLPRHDAARSARREPLQSEVVRAPRVLLVFGPNIDHDVAISIGQAGYNVILVSSARDAAAQLGAGPLDVLVVDGELGQSVASLPHTARALYPDLQVIGVEVGSHPDLNQLDCDLNIRRPVYAHTLIENIDAALQGNSSEDERSSA